MQPSEPPEPLFTSDFLRRGRYTAVTQIRICEEMKLGRAWHPAAPVLELVNTALCAQHAIECDMDMDVLKTWRERSGR